MKTYKEQGVIVKPFCYKSLTSPMSEHYNDKGHGAIVIDTRNNMVDVDILSGPDPYARDIILFLLSDRHVRLMIRKYQQTYKRDREYAFRTSTGNSGRQDIYINYYNSLGLQTGGKKLLHESSFGKLNEGWIKMWIGDFVELVALLMSQSVINCGLKDVRRLRKSSECHYVRGYFCEDATKRVSKII